MDCCHAGRANMSTGGDLNADGNHDLFAFSSFSEWLGLRQKTEVPDYKRPVQLRKEREAAMRR